MDIALLNQAFNTFTEASRSLESYYHTLQQRVDYLTEELAQKNQELNIALEEAEKSKDFLNAVLQSLEDAIIVIDPEGIVTMINTSATALLGCATAKAIGQFFTDLQFSILREGPDVSLVADGKRYDIMLSQSSVIDSRGALRGSVVLVKDITRLKELELRQERNQRLISMGEMAARIVHEVRNPLCSMELFANLLAKDLEGTAHSQLAQGISTGISNLNTILTNMLYFAKPRKLARKRVSLSAVIDETLFLFMPLVQSRGVLLKRSTDDWEIEADPEFLKQVLMNIMVNALQAVRDNGQIDVSTRWTEGFAVIDITDNGGGIPAENMEKIFDPFFSTKDSGTGLGLAIASKIMQAHGGYIKVRSAEGIGSTLSLHLPASREVSA